MTLAFTKVLVIDYFIFQQGCLVGAGISFTMCLWVSIGARANAVKSYNPPLPSIPITGCPVLNNTLLGNVSSALLYGINGLNVTTTENTLSAFTTASVSYDIGINTSSFPSVGERNL